MSGIALRLQNVNAYVESCLIGETNAAIVVDQAEDLSNQTEANHIFFPNRTNRTEPPFPRQLTYLTYKYN
jgi:hypothetical protein